MLFALWALPALLAIGGCGGSTHSQSTEAQGQFHAEDRHQISKLPPAQRARLREMLSEAEASK